MAAHHGMAHNKGLTPTNRAKEVAHWLKGNAVLQEDQISVLSTLTGL